MTSSHLPRALLARGYRHTLPRPHFSSSLRSYATSSTTTTASSGITSTTSSTSSSSSSSPTSNPAPGPPSPNSPFVIFDRNAKRLQKDRAASRRRLTKDGTSFEGEAGENSRLTDYVRREMAANVAERISYIKRDYPTIVDLGSGPGYLRHHIDKEATGCKKIVMCDFSKSSLHRDEHLDKDLPFEFERHVVDEESLPFSENSLDIVVSCGSLHWTNDLPGALIQIQRSLKPDGVFIGALLGGDSLFELRTSLQLAEQEREGGISPRVSPMTETRDLASLLSRAGFNMPTVDSDEIEVHYPSMFELVHDLRDMGESNAVINRRGNLRRDTLVAASAIYKAMHGLEEEDVVPATFSVIYVIGWKPDVSQRKPLSRGSASHNLKDVLGEGEEGEEGKEGGEGKGQGEGGQGKGKGEGKV